MPQYRRATQKGGQYFFTVVTGKRQPILTLDPVRLALRESIHEVRIHSPFIIDAWVLLPDHMHCIWTLPENDSNYAKRWSIIKRLVSKSITGIIAPPITTTSQKKRKESGLWQRRFWEHVIRDSTDFQRHLDYMHFNPVKHGLVNRVSDWPYSSFHRYVDEGIYPPDWGGSKVIDSGEFGE